MADQITNYKCPACTGPLHFTGTSGKMECDYCGSTYSVEEIEKLYADQNATAADATAQANAPENADDEWQCSSREWTDPGMRAYSCPSCGAELIFDETTAATACPYCGNTTIIPGQFAGTLKPEYVIPFKLDKSSAESALKGYYKKKPFLPDSFATDNHIEELKGVYVPFWLYDGTVHADGLYAAEKKHTHTAGNYRVTVTEHFRVERGGDISFEKIPADASSKMPDDMMDSIEPYDYTELTEFTAAYMAGFIADKYDVSAEDNAERAADRAKQSALNAIRADIHGYNRTKTVSESASVKQGKISYAMLPVWLLNTKWNGQNYLFAMNGQSGRFVGALPVDKKKVLKFFAILTAILEAVMGLTVFALSVTVTLLSGLLMFGALPFGLSAIVTAIRKGKMNNVALASNASAYITEDGMNFTRRSDIFIRRTETRTPIENKK